MLQVASKSVNYFTLIYVIFEVDFVTVPVWYFIIKYMTLSIDETLDFWLRLWQI